MYVIISGFNGECGVETELVGVVKTKKDAKRVIKDYIEANYSDDAAIESDEGVNVLTYDIEDPDLEYPEFIHAHKATLPE